VELSGRSSELFLYISKTLSRNPQGSAVSLKQFIFRQTEMLIKHNLNRSNSIAILPTMEIFLEQCHVAWPC
jgi:hypothetical protein